MSVLVLISWAFGAINSRDARDKRISVAEGKAHVLEKEARGRGLF